MSWVVRSAILSQRKGSSHVWDNNLCFTFSSGIPRNAWQRCELHHKTGNSLWGIKQSDGREESQHLQSSLQKAPVLWISPMTLGTLEDLNTPVWAHVHVQALIMNDSETRMWSRQKTLKDEDNPDEVNYWRRSLIFLVWMHNWAGQKYTCVHLFIYSLESHGFWSSKQNFQELWLCSCTRKLPL